MLHLRNVQKKFGLSEVVRGITLDIAPQEIVGLAGPSGSGKSTLLRCIQGLETLDGGSITRGGDCGFIFQDFQLFPHMTVWENITYAPLRLGAIPAAEILQRAADFLVKMNLVDKKDTLPNQLSGGQKQRVALSRGLMMNPQILLCDEPTSGQDFATIQDVAQLFSSVKTQGMTLVIASHDLDFLVNVTQRIVMLKAGAVVGDVRLRGDLSAAVAHLKTYY